MANLKWSGAQTWKIIGPTDFWQISKDPDLKNGEFLFPPMFCQNSSKFHTLILEKFRKIPIFGKKPNIFKKKSRILGTIRF